MVGIVDLILIFYIVLCSGDNKWIIVFNGVLFNGMVINYFVELLCKVIFDVGIDYDVDLKNV